MNTPPELSVIIPFHGSTTQLAQCLDALAASTRRPDEIILVDDACPGGIPAEIRARVDRAARLPERRGPGAARNAGVALARGGILFFIDADVLVHPDTIALGLAHLMAHPDVAAVMGSYDDTPAEPDFFSQFKNLLHHYVHQHSPGETSSFWGACGVMRRDAFEAVNGFDGERYPDASIEDIDLGYRLKARGYRLRLDRCILVKHLKRWTFRSMVRTDILRRAVPWADLMLESGGLVNDLNTRVTDRISAGCCCVTVACLMLAIQWPALLAVAAAAALTNGILNRALYGFFLRKRGLGFTVRAVPVHMLYLLYSAVTFACRMMRFRARRVMGRPA